MKKTVLTLIIPFLISPFSGMTTMLNAQNGEPCFDPGFTQNPFGITESTNGSALVRLVDIDHDDTLEVFAGINTGSLVLHYYENAGSNEAPKFVNPQPAPFGLNTAPIQYVDIDGDSLHEAFIGRFEENYPIKMIENTGDPSSPNFEGPEEPNPYGITLPESALDGSLLDQASPTFVDIDNDGDYDVFINGRFVNSLADEALFFRENIGDATSPEFDTIVANPFGFDVQLSEHARFMTFADMDCDDDFDMYISNIPTNITFYIENKGTPEEADFSTGGVNPVSNYNSPFSPAGGAFIDIGGDGDMDLINGSFNMGIQLYENIGTTTMDCPCYLIDKVEENEFDGSISLSPNPAQDELQLKISTASVLKEVQLSIYDVTGRPILTMQPKPIGNEISETIDVGHLSTNIYFVEVKINGHSLTRKIRIQ